MGRPTGTVLRQQEKYGCEFQELILGGFQRHGESFTGGLLERSPSGSRVFINVMRAEGNLTLEEFDRLILMTEHTWLSDVTIFVQGHPTAGLNRILNRQQTGDKGITGEYLERIYDAYQRALSPSSGIDWGQLHCVDGLQSAA